MERLKDVRSLAIPLSIAAFLTVATNAQVEAEYCPIPLTPENLSIEVEPNTSNSNDTLIPDKESSIMVLASWDPVPEADGYNFRLTRLDSQTDQRLPDIIIDNWYGTRIEVRLPYGLFNPQPYSAWVQAVNRCGASKATGITFPGNTNTDKPNLKLSPVNN